jgi:uncharacterized protein
MAENQILITPNIAPSKNTARTTTRSRQGTGLIVGSATMLGLVVLDNWLRRKILARLALCPRVVGKSTPLDAGMPFEEVWFPSRDGLKLHGWFIPGHPEGKARSKNITVIMGHGHAGNKEPDLHYALFFHQAGYNVLMFDFRGHGQSEGTRGSSMGYWERLDVHGAVDWLLGRGLARFAAFGISMGGSILIMAAGENPYIRAVITDCAYAQAYRSIASEMSNIYGLPMWLTRPFGRYAWWKMAKYHRFAWKNSSPADYVGNIAPRALLLIHGEQDKVTRIENAYLLYKLANQPKELWVLPDVGHTDGYSAYGTAYSERILNFLERVDWEAAPDLRAPARTLDGVMTGR